MGITTYARISRFFAHHIASKNFVTVGKLVFSSNLSGFTLVELIVVSAVSVLLLVAGISILNPGLQIQRANDAKRKAHVSKIQTALELFRSDLGYYPSDSVGFNALYLGTPQYLPKNPNGEPKTSDVYYYSASPAGCDNATTGLCTGYTLIACLENSADAERDSVNDTSCTSPLWSKTVTNP